MKNEDNNMLNLEVTTKLSQAEAANRFMKFFGKGGLGLEALEDPRKLYFQGGGGYVSATMCPDGDKTQVTLVTQEWEYQVKEFDSRLS
jgi:hypothetical protein